MNSLAQSSLQFAAPKVATILNHALEGRELSVAQGIRLSDVRERDLHALVLTADELRERQVGERVGYVVNRNINFTNVCVKSCRFCAFARGARSEQGYFLPVEEVVRRAVEAHAYGATEVCIQAGLAPRLTKDHYVRVITEIKRAVPSLHLHAYSPEEIAFGAALGRVSVRDFLIELKAAGLGSLPGTSAEILDDRLRKQISPTRISTQNWIEVITTAHSLGIPTTSTMMYGHVESAEDRMKHLALLRSIQKETRGITEFVPLSFVHEEAPLFARDHAAGVRPGPSGDDVVRLYAISRLMLGAEISNLQTAWVKDGLAQAQWLLHCGANDMGGTLMNESISTSAGAHHGQLMKPSILRRVIRDAGRMPYQRSTAYQTVREFNADAAQDELEALDRVDNADITFGSYAQLVADEQYRYEPERMVALRIAR